MNHNHKQAPTAPKLSPDISQPISEGDARQRHQNYLLNGPHVFTTGGQIVRSFSINQDDLKTLCDYAQQGIRLHFCQEETGNLNIVVVPIDESGNLTLGYENALPRPIINTLEPCPSICGCEFSETSLNSYFDLTGKKFYWLDPNNPVNGKVWYCQNADGSRQYVDTPPGAPQKQNS